MPTPPLAIAGQTRLDARLINGLVEELRQLRSEVNTLKAQADGLPMILRVTVVEVSVSPSPAVGEDPLPSTVTYTVRPLGGDDDGSIDVPGLRPWVGGVVADDSVGIRPAAIGERGLLIRYPRADQDGPDGGVFDTVLILPEMIRWSDCA